MKKSIRDHFLVKKSWIFGWGSLVKKVTRKIPNSEISKKSRFSVSYDPLECSDRSHTMWASSGHEYYPSYPKACAEGDRKPSCSELFFGRTRPLHLLFGQRKRLCLVKTCEPANTDDFGTVNLENQDLENRPRFFSTKICHASSVPKIHFKIKNPLQSVANCFFFRKTVFVRAGKMSCVTLGLHCSN